MTVAEGRQLRTQLLKEIEQGIDVDFNKQWVECLNKSILKGVLEGWSKAMKKINK